MTSDRYPDFVIAGAPKCGSSTLTFYLDQHPNDLHGAVEGALDLSRPVVRF